MNNKQDDGITEYETYHKFQGSAFDHWFSHHTVGPFLLFLLIYCVVVGSGMWGYLIFRG